MKISSGGLPKELLSDEDEAIKSNSVDASKFIVPAIGGKNYVA